MADVIFKEGDHAIYDSMNPEEYTFYRIENNDTDSIDPYDVYLGDIQLNNGRYISYIIDKITDLTKRIYDLEHPFLLLNDYTVNEVINIINNGDAENYWSVGDATNEIPLSGEVGCYTFDNEPWRATIIGFNHNSELETNDCYSMTLQFGQTEDEISIAFVDSSYNSTGTSAAFRMNTSNTNVGGWESSYMRNTICAQFLEALPRSLRNNIGTTTKYTDNVGGNTGSVESNVTATEDKIFLLNGNETGITSSSYANIYEANYSENYSNYYTGSSRRVRHNHQDPSTSIPWWTRSLANSSSSNWLRITASGYGNGSAYTSIGFAPAFTLIGETPPYIDEEAFAIYCADDGSLTFYYGKIPNEGEQYNNKTVTTIYTDFIDTDYTEENLTPWHQDGSYTSVKTVMFDNSFSEVRPKYLAYWFWGMSNCTNMDITNLDSSETIDMHDTFSGLENLESLDVSHLDVHNVECLYGTFYNCAKLTTIDVSNWQTDSLTDMHGIFDTCSSLKSVDLTGWDTSKNTDLERLFYRCYDLTSVDVSKIDTSHVTSMRNMFGDCSSLTTLDVSKFDTTKVTNMRDMFSGCSNLTTIYSNDDVFITSTVTSSSQMFSGCTKLQGTYGTIYDSNKTDVSMAHIDDENGGYFSLRYFAIYSNDDKSLRFYSDTEPMPAVGDTYNGKIITYIYTDFLNQDLSSYRYAIWTSDIFDINDVSIYVDSSFSKVASTMTNYWFAEFENGNSLDVTYLNMSKVIDMSYMFANTTFSEISGLEYWNTQSVTNMTRIFYYTTGVTALNVSNWNTSNIDDMSYLFYRARSLQTIQGLNTWDTSKVTNMGYMFYNCTSLSALDLSNFNTSNVTNMGNMFDNCGSLSSLDISNFNTSKVRYMNEMFDSCSNIKILDLRSFDTHAVDESYWMFERCQNLTTIYVNSELFDIADSWSDEMFYHCTSLIGGNGTVYSSNAVDGYEMAYCDTLSTDGYFTQTNINTILSDNNQDIIQSVLKEGNAENYWSIGDTCPITLYGDLGVWCSCLKTEPYRCYIIDFDHNMALETNNNHSITLSMEWVDENNPDRSQAFTSSTYTSNMPSSEDDDFIFDSVETPTQCHGWAGCQLRLNICTYALNIMTKKWRSIVGTTIKYTDTETTTEYLEKNITTTEDKIFILATNEVSNDEWWEENPYEKNYQTIYTWYKNNGSSYSIPAKYGGKYNKNSTVNWWLRSFVAEGLKVDGPWIAFVNTSGLVDGQYPSRCLGVVPCFNIIGN